MDQFGGEACPEIIVQWVREGKVSEERINQSIPRLLRDEFRLGLFDTPYLDVDAAEKIVGQPKSRKAGELTQRKSIGALKNKKDILPLKSGGKIRVENIKPEVITQDDEVVNDASKADVACLRLNRLYEKHKGMMEEFFHAGELGFKEPEKTCILNILNKVPTIVDIYLERPAVIPEIAAKNIRDSVTSA